MNKQRKDKLQKRAYYYTRARVHPDYDDVVPWDLAYSGFQDGYRAAMKDARKALAEADSINSDSPIRVFLRPLR